MTTTDFIEITFGVLLFLAFIIFPIVLIAKMDKKKIQEHHANESIDQTEH